MIYVPTGTLHVGPSDQDVNSALVQKSKSVSIQGFYMDETEITNNEYRQFVYWTRDSIAHTILEHFKNKHITLFVQRFRLPIGQKLVWFTIHA